MNWERVERNWKDFQGKLNHQWSKLTSDDLNQIRGQRNALVAKLQERYAIDRHAAEHQIEDWMHTISEQTGKAGDSFEGAYENWFDRMMDVQRHSTDLMSECMRKAAELPVRLAECRNPADIAKAQADFASTMVSDCYEAGRKILGTLTAATQNLARDQGEAIGQQMQSLKGNGRRSLTR